MPNKAKRIMKLYRKGHCSEQIRIMSDGQMFSFLPSIERRKEVQTREECEQSFQALKEHLGKAPLLAKPGKEEKLQLYLAVFKVEVNYLGQRGRTTTITNLLRKQSLLKNETFLKDDKAAQS